MPKVSIIVPMFRAEQYIVRCIDSLRMQLEKDIEVVLVDDCSPDHTVEKAKKAIEGDSRFRIITLQTNKGPMTARQTGYLNAIGDYITFCDADDYLPNNSISALYSAAIESCADIVSGNIKRVNEAGSESIISSKLSCGSARMGIFQSLLKGEMGHNLCSKLFRRGLLLDYPYITYDNFNNGEDCLLFYQIVDNVSKMIHINSIVYYYWDNATSSSRIRLGHNALNNIIIANKCRYDICKKYPSLNILLHRKIILSINELYHNGYNRDGILSSCIKEAGLSSIYSIDSIIKYFNLKEAINILIKGMIIPFVHRLLN